MEAIRHGFSVYFVSLPDLLDRLVQAQAENRNAQEDGPSAQVPPPDPRLM